MNEPNRPHSTITRTNFTLLPQKINTNRAVRRRDILLLVFRRSLDLFYNLGKRVDEKITSPGLETLAAGVGFGRLNIF